MNINMKIHKLYTFLLRNVADFEPEKCQMKSCLILSTKLQIVGGGISEWADVNKINEDTALLFA